MPRRIPWACLIVCLNLACDGQTSTPSEPDAQACSDFELDVERYWSRETKAKVRAGILAADASFGRTVAERVETRMDAVTQDWVLMQQKICKDTVIRKVMPVEVYNKVSTCLMGNLSQQRQLVVVASSARADQLELLESTIDATGADMRMCLDKAVYSYYEQDEAPAREALAEAKIYRSLGDDAKADTAVQQALVQAEQSESVGLRVDAWVEEGEVMAGKADYANARNLATRALAEAEKGGYELGIAKAAMLRGRIAHEMADYDAALVDYHKALSIRERILGSDDILMASSYNGLGLAYHFKGEHDKALEYHLKALALDERFLGTDDLHTAIDYSNIGLVYYGKGEHDKALEYFRKALAIEERILGSDHRSIADAYNNIGGVYADMGNYDAALEYHRKALAIRDQTLGAAHPHTAISLWSIGAALRTKEEYAEALAHYRKALTIFERVFGAEHPYTTGTREGIATLCQKHAPACRH